MLLTHHTYELYQAMTKPATENGPILTSSDRVAVNNLIYALLSKDKETVPYQCALAAEFETVFPNAPIVHIQQLLMGTFVGTQEDFLKKNMGIMKKALQTALSYQHTNPTTIVGVDPKDKEGRLWVTNDTRKELDQALTTTFGYGYGIDLKGVISTRNGMSKEHLDPTKRPRTPNPPYKVSVDTVEVEGNRSKQIVVLRDMLTFINQYTPDKILLKSPGPIASILVQRAKERNRDGKFKIMKFVVALSTMNYVTYSYWGGEYSERGPTYLGGESDHAVASYACFDRKITTEVSFDIEITDPRDIEQLWNMANQLMTLCWSYSSNKPLPTTVVGSTQTSTPAIVTVPSAPPRRHHLFDYTQKVCVSDTRLAKAIADIFGGTVPTKDNTTKTMKATENLIRLGGVV